MSKQNKQIVKISNYKRKAYWQTIADVFRYGYTGKLGNLINFDSYKMSKSIDLFTDKYFNDRRISVILIIITVILCLYIWFS